MDTRPTSFPRALKALVPALALIACGKSAQVKASITDAPIDGVSVFQITVSQVRFHVDSDEGENLGEDRAIAQTDADQDGARGKGWTVLCTGTETFDLMKLQPLPTGAKVYAALCGGNSATVPAGKVDAFWLDVTHIHLEFKDPTLKPLDFDLPHGPQSGLKIHVDDDAEKGSEVELRIDFDAGNSLFKDVTGNYQVHPTLRQVR